MSTNAPLALLSLTVSTVVAGNPSFGDVGDGISLVGDGISLVVNPNDPPKQL